MMAIKYPYAILRVAIPLVAAAIMLMSGSLAACAEDSGSRVNPETVRHADIVTSMNPAGLMLVLGGFQRWSGPIDQDYGIPSSHNQLGAFVGISPAYAQASAYAEWKPLLFAQMRLQYSLYSFFGDNGALLSFPSGDSKYGKHEVDARSGQEETGWGQRIMLQPVVIARAGPVIIRNTTDLAYYRFNGRGPFFLEWEYDTLLKDGDTLLNNRTAFLMEAWKGTGSGILLAGPYYEITHASEAGINRQRSGIQIFWTPAESLGYFNHPRIYALAGMNLQDRNRDNEGFVTAGMGFDF